MALTLMVAGCAAGEDEAVAACSTFQDHLESMRAGDDRQRGLHLAGVAADAAAESGDDEFAEAFEDYHRVIVRFALAQDDVEVAAQRVDQASDDELQLSEDELADARARLAGLIEAGDLVLTRINAGCDEHGTSLE